MIGTPGYLCPIGLITKASLLGGVGFAVAMNWGQTACSFHDFSCRTGFGAPLLDIINHVISCRTVTTPPFGLKPRPSPGRHTKRNEWSLACLLSRCKMKQGRSHLLTGLGQPLVASWLFLSLSGTLRPVGPAPPSVMLDRQSDGRRSPNVSYWRCP